jgi:valyl-tRNA synthetase
MDAVTDGRVKFFPERYANSYLDWLAEKRDWCISRQLWWGHRIPVWRPHARWTMTPKQMRSWMGKLQESHPNEVAVRWLTESGMTDVPPEPFGTPLVCLAPGADHIADKELHGFQQDPDVLDTWFSSMLWPHSTFGWPEATPELQYYYPTSVLVTSRDIITLWVARMVIAGLYNLNQVPFHHVYITVKLLDGFGETMSKSKGNGVDPLDIIDRYGADALRFLIVQMSTETQDARLPVSNVCPHCDALVPVKQEHMYMRTRKVTCPNCKQPFRPGGPWPTEDAELKTAKQASERFEIGRNFANKIWNAARFILMNLEGYTPQALKLDELPIEDRWILSRLASTTKAVTESLENYHFSDVARGLYEFVWTEFCDWYVEMAKGRLKESGVRNQESGVRGQESEPSHRMSAAIPGGAGRQTVQRVLVGVLDSILKLIQPIMPFVAESIWQALNESAFERGLPSPEPAMESVVIAAWPSYPADWQDTAIEARMARMQELVRAVREVRNRYTIDPKKNLDVFVRASDAVADDFRTLTPFITQRAGVAKLETGANVAKPPQAAGHVTPDFEAYVSLAGLIDRDVERKRLEKQIAEKKKHLQGALAKLDNPNFVNKAPAEVVQQLREQVEELKKQIAALETNMRELDS